MNKIFCGQTGEDSVSVSKLLSDLPIDKSLQDALIAYYGEDLTLRPTQEKAFFEHELLDERRNVLLTTPTNSGKTMIAYLLLFREALKGKRVILIEPMRALAREKQEELAQICGLLKTNSGIDIKIAISTGDYRINDQFMDDKVDIKTTKKKLGEIIIATPERLDSISRIKEQGKWFEDTSLVCIDEAHLIGDSNRGLALEMLITYFRSLRNNPQLVLLSATIINSDDLAEWLKPCLIVKDIPRYPTLEKWVYSLEEDEDANCYIAEEVEETLKDELNSVLIFVYRTESTEKLAHLLIGKLKGAKIKKGELDRAIENKVAWYHASMSAASRNKVSIALLNEKVRVVVSTTALAMGVNLPTTHVIIRDLTFTGVKELDLGEITQMVGRAGRGNKPGTGIVFHRPKDKISIDTLTRGLEDEICPKIISQFIKTNVELPFFNFNGRSDNRLDQFQSSKVNNQVLGVLHRLSPVKYDALTEYFLLSWGGKNYIECLPADLEKLGRWKMVYFDGDNQSYALTSLGKTAAKCYLPPLTAANIGQLFRDLIGDRTSGEHLKYLSPLDLLIILCLASDELKPIVRYSAKLLTQIESYMEAITIPEKSYLYRKWIRSEPDALVGSLSVEQSVNNMDALKTAYQNTHLAMLIYDLSLGKRGDDLKEFYRVDVAEVEEKILDIVIWLLYGLEQILEIPNFYYHLKAKCELPEEGIIQIDNEFKRLSGYVFRLLPNLKYRSALGELVRGIKMVYPNQDRYPGINTIKRLEEVGISTIKELINKKTGDLLTIGIQKQYAEQIVKYVQRRVGS